jgi:drug/metabolite transporter (DMT)-like permease
MNAPAIEHKDEIMKGIASAVLAFFFLTVMNVFVKLLAETHHIAEIAFYRNAIPIAFVLAYALFRKKPDIFKTRKPRAMLLRVVIGTTGLYLTFGAVKLLPLADATVLFFVATLIAPVLSVFILKEYIGPHRWMAIAIGFTGVLLIAQPHGNFQLLGTLVALGAALCHAIVQVMLRHLKTESSITVAFYFMLGGMLVSACFLPFVAKSATPLEMLYFLGLGLSGGAGQYFITSSFRLAPASVIVPFNYTGLIWATGFDILIWHYVPGWPVFAGASIIIVSKLYFIYRERLQEKRKAQSL